MHHLRAACTGASWAGPPQPVSQLLVLPLLALMAAPAAATRASAVKVLTMMVGHMPSGLQDNLDPYLQVGVQGSG